MSGHGGTVMQWVVEVEVDVDVIRSDELFLGTRVNLGGARS